MTAFQQHLLIDNLYLYLGVIALLSFSASCSREDLLKNPQQQIDPNSYTLLRDSTVNNVEDIASAPKATIQTIMPLNGNYSPHPQGGDCFGNIFFQFSTGNRVVRIYDLLKKELIQTLSIDEKNRGFVSNCHCNTVCFGTTYFDKNDDFPLLYVSTGYTASRHSGALVYRILKEENEFNLTLVQTIRFPIIDNVSWTEFIPAGDISFIRYGHSFYEIKTPSLQEGDILFSPEDSTRIVKFPERPSWLQGSRGQDQKFRNGKIIMTSGVPQTSEESAFIIMDLSRKEWEFILDFKKIGLYNESESVFFWGERLCIAFTDRIVSIDLSEFNFF